ncbi:MAG: hypothetical protein IJR35_01120 [Synergistaceae bacterium]|nr:hypothetical protein [Synergistaceae bacterium]MBQ9404978.1 hypothetical protein [Synergistaceae bacterium]MBQ9594442.1 hypothetical protein [Synergistaceae bacterium]
MPDNYSSFEISSLLAGLNEEDYAHALSYIRYLYANRNNANKVERQFAEIRELIGEDRGWNSEEEMIRDMAEFRRSRMSENTR